MKNLLAIVACLFFIVSGKAQNVGIGTNSPNASAILDLQSSSKAYSYPE